MNTSVKETTRKLLDQQTQSGKHKRRKINDLIARYSIGLGGLSVIGAVGLICFYLFWVVFPIFIPASVELEQDYSWQQAEPQYMAVEEYGEIAFSISKSGDLGFFSTEDGQMITKARFSHDAQPTAFAELDLKGLMAAGFADGSFQLFSHKYKISYPNNERHIEPQLLYPFGEDNFELTDTEITRLFGSRWEDGIVLASVGADQKVTTVTYSIEQNFLTEELTLTEESRDSFDIPFAPKYVLTTPGPDWLYIISEQGDLIAYRHIDDEWEFHESQSLFDQNKGTDGKTVTEAVFLLGQTSLLIGDSDGVISQWFQVRGDDGFNLRKIRDFKLSENAISQIIIEKRRKGFIAADSGGKMGIFYTTSERQLEEFDFGQELQALAINSRSNRLVGVGEDGKATVFAVENEHPEISWSAIWSEVWYESYEEPSYTWQSSASTNDFESKFSLVPLSFGTFKASIYAMLFAVPLAIFGAIFTAYFMAPKMRSMVKPTVEIMEALPTVILGFLAGLWLAPLIEEHLAGVILLIILLPVVTVLFGLTWSKLPGSIKHRVPDGWQAALLFPIIILGTFLAFWLGEPVESAMFNGNMPAWLNEQGITYDQRNSLVVGIAMGFAVIPTIFSITEDAIFSVPKHLSNGSLALGASQWQTLTRVVIPTASPGIFSALMIGLGRAVGETMIVLMATGNTPIMDMNIFEGFRTLSANIAVEMPESEVGSSHYRVLFLAAFVLFLFTFVFNTIAEIVRQRLRNKYGSL